MSRPDVSEDASDDPRQSLAELERLRARVAELERQLRLADQAAFATTAGGPHPAQPALAADNAALYQEAERRRREAEALATVARAIIASLDLDTVLRLVAEAARELCASDLATIALREPGSDVLLARYRVGPTALPSEAYRIELGKGIGGLVLATGRPFRTDDYAADPRITKDYVERSRREGVVAEVAVPMGIEGRVEGVVFVHNRSARPFTERDVASLLQLAEHAAIAIKNARLYEVAQTRAARLRTLMRLNRLVSSSLDLDEVLSDLARAAAELVGARLAVIWMADEAARVLVTRAFSDPHLGAQYPVTQITYDQGLAGWTATFRRPLDVPDVRADTRSLLREWLRAQGLTSAYLVPIQHQDSLFGVLAMIGSRPFRFGADETELLDSFVAQATVAIQNARLFSGTEARRRAAEALAQVGRALTETLDVDLVARRIADRLRELFDAEVTFVYRLEPSGDLVAMAATGQEGPEGRLAGSPPFLLPRGTGVAAVAVRERRPIVTTDVLNDPRVTFAPETRLYLAQSTARAGLAVPLVTRDRVLGALALRAVRPFDEQAIQLAEAFADQAAVALENARLYQEARRAYDEVARTQEQLVQSQRMEAIGRLAGGVAHDFNNLLTVIAGRAGLLLTRPDLNASLRGDLELIAQTGERAAALTRQLLTFSRRQVLQVRTLDINILVTNMASMLKRLIGENIDLVTRLQPALRWVTADPAQLEQVVMNLVVNARDAMPDGGRLLLETADVELDEAFVAGHPGAAAAGPHVQLVVSDTGIGMSTQTQARLFEPFFTTKPLGSGTGLGLSVVYGVVVQHRGAIAVESEPGRGSSFRIYLPRAVEGVGVSAPAPLAAVAPRGSETVLLVEDEEDVRDLMQLVLRRSGYTVVEAHNGQEALEMAHLFRGRLDLVVTDVVMPGMSGRQLAQRLRAEHPDTRVLYVSGYPEDALGLSWELEHDAALLQKPFTTGALARKVRDVLDAPKKPHPTS